MSTGSFPASSAAIAETNGFIDIENTSNDDTVFEIAFDVTYSVFASAVSDSIDDIVDAFADAGLFINTDGDLLDPGSNFIPAFGGFEVFESAEAFAIDDYYEETLSDTFSVSIVLDPGEYFDIFSLADTEGSINGDLLPIPVGPAAPLLLGALGTFGFLRRRKRA